MSRACRVLRRRLLLGAATLAIAASLQSVATAGAGTIETTTTIRPGALVLVPGSTAAFVPRNIGGAIELTGTLDAATVVDARGTGAGWHVTMVVAPFRSETGQDLPPGQLTVFGLEVDRVAGTAPASVERFPFSFDSDVPRGAPWTLLSAARGSGMGTFRLKPTLTIRIPGGPFTERYATNVTLSIASGP